MSNHSTSFNMPNLQNTTLALVDLATARAPARVGRVAPAIGVATVLTVSQPVAVAMVVAGFAGANIALGEDAVLGADEHARVTLGDELDAFFVDGGAGDGLVDGVVDDVDGAVGALDEGAGGAFD